MTNLEANRVARQHRKESRAQFDSPLADSVIEPGPIAMGVGRFFTIVGPILILGAYPTRPTLITLIALMPIGALLLLRREVLTSMRLSLALVGYVAWATASLTWAVSFDSTFIFIRIYLTAVVAMSLVASYMPRPIFIESLKRSMQVIIVMTLVGVIASPTGRSAAVLGGVDVSGGWRGYFGHKNLMSPVIVLATITNLAFEMNRRISMTILAFAAALMIGAQSITGLVAFVVALAAWMWTGAVSRGGQRERSIARVVTSLVGIVALGVVLSYVGTLVKAFGKDLTFSGRTDIWELSWPIIGEQPIQGYGLGGPYGDLRYQVGLQFFEALGFYVQHAHNALIDVLATLGIVGLVLILTLIFGCFRAAWKALDRSPRLARWVITMLMAMLFMGFSENLFSGSYMMLVAAMRIVLMMEAAPYADTPAPWSRGRGRADLRRIDREFSSLS